MTCCQIKSSSHKSLFLFSLILSFLIVLSSLLQADSLLGARCLGVCRKEQNIPLKWNEKLLAGDSNKEGNPHRSFILFRRPLKQCGFRVSQITLLWAMWRGYSQSTNSSKPCHQLHASQVNTSSLTHKVLIIIRTNMQVNTNKIAYSNKDLLCEQTPLVNDAFNCCINFANGNNAVGWKNSHKI